MFSSGEIQKGEKVFVQIRPSRWNYLAWYIIGGLFIVPSVLPGLLIILLIEFVRKAHLYIITNRRVISEYKLLSRRISSLNLEKIQDIHLTQGLFQRLFDIGNVYINTAGSSSIEISIKGVKNPLHIRRLIEEKANTKKN